MKAVFSGSGFLALNWTDFAKSLRVGFFALVGAFVAGATGAASQLDITTVLSNPKPAIAALVLAGATTAFDLIRRWLTNYGSTVTS